EQARRLGVGAQFTFVPAVPPSEVFLYHQLADVLITTRSRGTNTPLKIYQYLRAGRPIVATAIRSHTQVLDQACAELAAPPPCADLVAPPPAAIAAGIRRVLDDPARQKSLADGARRISRERYDEAIYL